MAIIDGAAISETIAAELKQEVAGLAEPPCVAFVRVGEDPASVSYVAKKQKMAQSIGMESRLSVFPTSITQEELLGEVEKRNEDTSIHGILVQAPLPDHVEERRIFNAVRPEKDVDGFSAANLGRLVQEDPQAFAACTPGGLIELLRRCDIPTKGRHVVIVGRSVIVGKPAGLLFLRKHAFGDATVTTCHSRTRNLPEITRQADILVAAIGRARFVTADMVKDGAVVLDVGINRIEDASRKSGFRLVGDVDYEAVAPQASWITPVPKGVGPMTVAMLMSNTVQAYRQQRGL